MMQESAYFIRAGDDSLGLPAGRPCVSGAQRTIVIDDDTSDARLGAEYRRHRDDGRPASRRERAKATATVPGRPAGCHRRAAGASRAEGAAGVPAAGQTTAVHHVLRRRHDGAGDRVHHAVERHRRAADLPGRRLRPARLRGRPLAHPDLGQLLRADPVLLRLRRRGVRVHHRVLRMDAGHQTHHHHLRRSTRSAPSC